MKAECGDIVRLNQYKGLWKVELIHGIGRYMVKKVGDDRYHIVGDSDIIIAGENNGTITK